MGLGGLLASWVLITSLLVLFLRRSRGPVFNYGEWMKNFDIEVSQDDRIWVRNLDLNNWWIKVTSYKVREPSSGINWVEGGIYTEHWVTLGFEDIEERSKADNWADMVIQIVRVIKEDGSTVTIMWFQGDGTAKKTVRFKKEDLFTYTEAVRGEFYPPSIVFEGDEWRIGS